MLNTQKKLTAEELAKIKTEEFNQDLIELFGEGLSDNELKETQENNVIELIKEGYASDGIINNWYDCWYQPDKQYGFPIIANEDYYNIASVGIKDFSKIQEEIKYSNENKVDRYMTLNAFKAMDKFNKHSARSTKNLLQFRNIGIDIDQYDLGLTIPEAFDYINNLIRNGRIPTPNLVLASNGIQLFYSIKGGMSKHRTKTISHLTTQIIKELEDIGADYKATDPARLMRLPESLNTRNDRVVHPEIWEKIPYTYHELLKWFPVKTNPNVNERIVLQGLNLKTELMYNTNMARLDDFKTLIHLRDGHFPSMRNTLLYNYTFHYALIETKFDKILQEMTDVFSNTVYSSTAKGSKFLNTKEIVRTVKSSYEDAKKFIQYYQENNYTITFVEKDGIVKPKKTETLLKELEITIKEQQYMKTIAYKHTKIKNRNRKKRQDITKKRRAKGIKSMDEYNKERRLKRFETSNKLYELIQKYPNKTQAEYAKMLGVHRSTVSRLMKNILKY